MRWQCSIISWATHQDRNLSELKTGAFTINLIVNVPVFNSDQLLTIFLGGWPMRLYCHLPGTGEIFQFQLPIPNPSTSRLTILTKHDYMLLISYSLTSSNPRPRSSVPFSCPPCVAPPRCSPPCAPQPSPAPRCCPSCSTPPRPYSSLLSSM